MRATCSLLYSEHLSLSLWFFYKPCCRLRWRIISERSSQLLWHLLSKVTPEASHWDVPPMHTWDRITNPWMVRWRLARLDALGLQRSTLLLVVVSYLPSSVYVLPARVLVVPHQDFWSKWTLLRRFPWTSLRGEETLSVQLNLKRARKSHSDLSLQHCRTSSSRRWRESSRCCRSSRVSHRISC